MALSKKILSTALYQDFLKQFLKRISSYDCQIWGEEELQKIAHAAFSKFEKHKLSEATNKRVKIALRKAQGNATDNFTLFILINPDMPFLVDSTIAAFRNEGLSLDLIVHFVLWVKRDEKGKLLSIFAPEKKDHLLSSFHPEAFICILVEQEISSHKLNVFDKTLERIYADVTKAVEDWPLMRAEMKSVSTHLLSLVCPQKKEGLPEIKDFFKWLLEDHFTFLGYRSYHLKENKVVFEQGLGIAQDPSRCFFEGEADFLHPSCLLNKKSSLFELLTLTKSSYPSLVHRSVPMDVLRVERLDDAGEIIGEFQFFGLLTSSAYSQSVKDIPLLRSKVLYVLNKVGFLPNSHDGKALIHIIETLPRDTLFQMTEEELATTSMAILNLQEREQLAFFVRKDPFGHLISCLLYVPKDHYNLKFLEKTKQILAHFFHGTLLSWHSFLSDLAYARINFIYSFSKEAFLSFNEKELEKKIQHLTLTWEDKLRNLLTKEKGEKRGKHLYEEYKNVFPSLYQERFTEEVAIEDIDHLETLKEQSQKNHNEAPPISVRIQTWMHTKNPFYPGKYHIKVYVFKEALSLSKVLPLFENLGLKVIKENNVLLSWHGYFLWIHDFEIENLFSLEREKVIKIKPLLEEAFLEIITEKYENDTFNKLVVSAGISIHQVHIFRAYARYLKQIQFPYSQEYIASILCKHPQYVQKIKDIFYLRFDPSLQKKPERRNLIFDKEQQAYKKNLSLIQSLDEDRVLRSFIDLTGAIQRTSFFQRTAEGNRREILSFKIFSSLLPECPFPRPRCEIFVYSPRVEGVHLRGGLIARGGIRFSDRKEDYRTEILGLFKAQTLKNAVIVPVGAKGGFIAKKLPPPTEREDFQKESITAYTLFIRGLLDLTDNLKDNKNISPLNTIRYDVDDSYLVVAADKGTATFSDIANSISESYDFWLGDAFASGGSYGYDHKKIAITARGAWISVTRHFWEMNIDITQTPFRVIGIGDMSGDVFGNGMLLSDKIKLIAAFDNRHIFLDPNPDPIKSFAERKRLFEIPRSSWADYTSELISTGGGVYSRSLKEIPLSLEVQTMLSLTQDIIEPNLLIQYLLKAEYDLLWLGGVGTFVKASYENNIDVGDRQNDAIRVDASDLRCLVVGEGANLGFTQQARIEYALQGGHINMDAIDNSAGVDCSDHEVNLKILFQKALEQNILTYEKRNLLLEEIEADVAQHVLRDNTLQTLTLSIAQEQGVSILDQQIRLIQKLEEEERLNRDLEGLPPDKILTERHAHGVGLTRPELSVLLSHSKIYLKEVLLRSSFLEEPRLGPIYASYFPLLITQQLPEFLDKHPLKKEILSLCLSNFIIARTGITFVYEIAERSNSSIAEVVRAVLIMFHIFDLEKLIEEIENLHKYISAQTELHLYLKIIKFLQHTTLWFLNHEAMPSDITIDIYLFSLDVKKLLAFLPTYLTEEDKKRAETQISILEEKGVNSTVAKNFGYLNLLEASCHILYLAQKTKIPLEIIASFYFQIGEKFHFNWLREEAEKIIIVTYWDKLIVGGIIEDLNQIQSRLTYSILTLEGTKTTHATMEQWEKERVDKIQYCEKMYEDFKAQGTFTLSMLLLACRHLYQLS